MSKLTREERKRLGEEGMRKIEEGLTPDELAKLRREQQIIKEYIPRKYSITPELADCTRYETKDEAINYNELTSQELGELFAVKIADWIPHKEGNRPYWMDEQFIRYSFDCLKFATDLEVAMHYFQDYEFSAERIYNELEKCFYWRVGCFSRCRPIRAIAEHKNLSNAACICMLRAHDKGA